MTLNLCQFVQVGDPDEDHRYWGRPEDITRHRPAILLTPRSPGSDVIAETAAAMAAGAMVFENIGEVVFVISLGYL